MALDHILKAAPFTWGAGSVGSTGLGIGGWYLHEEVSNASWDHQLWKEGYSLNIPEASSWGPNVTDEDTFEEAKTLQSGPCFENFFSEVGKIEDVLAEAAVEDKSLEKNEQSGDQETKRAIGCAIQKISYKEKLTKVKSGFGAEEWRVLPKNMVYKSEITLKKGDLGLAVWTLWTGKLLVEQESDKFKEWKSTQEYKVFLLAKENKGWVAKGKYDVYSTEEYKMTRDKLISKKITMNVKGKEEIWFDTSVTYAQKKKYKEKDTWTNHQSVSFWEGGGGREFSKILVMGKATLSLFTGDSANREEIKERFKGKEFARTWYSHFNGVKGEWKEPKEFCEYMEKTKGKNVPWEDVYRARSICYKKVAVAQGDTQPKP